MNFLTGGFNEFLVIKQAFSHEVIVVEFDHVVTGGKVTRLLLSVSLFKIFDK